MKRWVAAGLAVFSSGFTVVGDSEVTTPIVWPGAEVAVVLQQDGSDDLADGSDLTAMRDSLSVWNAPACSRFRFVEAGPPSPTRGDAADGVNRVSFLESGWPSGASGAVALTTRRYDSAASPDVWTEADIILNGQDYRWATNGDLYAYDIQSTVTHELGHVLGLAHTPSPEATMYFGGRPGRTAWRTLQTDDVAGLCYLYPNPVGGFSCTADGDCPLFDNPYGGTPVRQRCAPPNCESGAAEDGQACWAGTDCVSGLCLRGLDWAPGIDPGFCTSACSPGSCAGGELCDDFTGVNTCLLGYDDCWRDEDCGGANEVCVMDLDARFRCVELCLTAANCGGGEVCHGGSGRNPPGFCRSPGGQGFGTACAHGYDCQSLYCAGGGVMPTCSHGPVPPDGAASDGAPQADGVGGDSTPADGVASDAGDAAGDAPPVGESILLSGGCACQARSAEGIALLAVLVLRRRRHLRPM